METVLSIFLVVLSAFAAAFAAHVIFHYTYHEFGEGDAKKKLRVSFVLALREFRLLDREEYSEYPSAYRLLKEWGLSPFRKK